MCRPMFGGLLSCLYLYPKMWPTYSLRANYSKRGLRDEIWLLCRSPHLLSYTELLNMALGVANDHALIKKSTVDRGGFLG